MWNVSLNFSSLEKIRAKQCFEKMDIDCGVLINSYRADNSVFKDDVSVAHIREHNQKLRYCGVNAHHKNGAAKNH